MNLHIYPSAFRYESRILKETKSIAEGTSFRRVVIAAVAGDDLPAKEVLDEKREVWRFFRGQGRPLPGLVGKAAAHIAWMFRVFNACRRQPFRAIHCHSLSVALLALVLKLWWGARLIYDTHELETETMGMHGVKQLGAKFTERLFIRFVDEVIVVSDSIADWYKNAYGLPQVHVVRNVPYFEPLPSTNEDLLRQRFSIPQSNIVFLYQGVLAAGRGMEVLVEAFSQGPKDRHLVFMGYGPLESTVHAAAKTNGNIHFHPAVPCHELARYTRGADVGVCLILDKCLSYRYCLPNKLFEYVMNGVPVLASRLPDLTAFVDANQCGWTLPPEAASLTQWLWRVTADEIRTKSDNARKSRLTLGWQHESTTLLRLFPNERLGSQSRAA